MARGSKPGERRGGRKKGVPNKVTEEVRAIAQPYAPAAIKEAARIAGLLPRQKGSDSDQARVAAINIILDRAYGKPKQPIEGEMLHGVSEELRQFIAGNKADGRSFLAFDGEDQDAEAETNERPLPDH